MAQRVWHPLNKPFSNRHGLARQRLFRFAQLALEGEQTIQSNPIQSLILHIEMHFAIVSFCWIETFQLTIFVDIWKTEEKKLTAISDREMKECLINEWSFMFFLHLRATTTIEMTKNSSHCNGIRWHFPWYKLCTCYNTRGIILIHLVVSKHLDTIRFERIGSYFKNKRKAATTDKNEEKKP